MAVKSVSEEPVVVLDRWGILQEHLGYRLVGIHSVTGRARVTSPIFAFEGPDADRGDRVRTHLQPARLDGRAGRRKDHPRAHAALRADTR